MAGAKKVAFSEAGAQRTQSLLRFNPHKVKLIGLDTDHKSRAEHWLYDERVHLPVDPVLVKELLDPQVGQLQPGRVIRDGGDALVAIGRQRVKACRAAFDQLLSQGVPEKDAVERVGFLAYPMHGDEVRSFRAMIIENTRRTQDVPTTLAKKIATAKDMGIPEATIGEDFGGISPRMVRMYLALLDCSRKVQASVDAGRLSVTAAEKLSKLPRAEQDAQLETLEAEGNTSIAEVDRAVKGARAGKRGEDAPYVRPTMGQLRRILRAQEAEEPLAEFEYIADEFLDAIRWIVGEKDTKRIKGLSAIMKAVTVVKRPKRAVEEEPEETDDVPFEGGEEE